jgi:putative transcriptional regulator
MWRATAGPAIRAVGLLGLVLFALGAGAALFAQKPRPGPTLPTVRLAKGVFLVAEEHVTEPFTGSVILLVAHGDTGTVGLIINRVTKVPLSEVLPEVKPSGKPAYPLFFGGPVALNGLMFVYRSAAPPEGAHHVMEDVFFSGERSRLESLLEEKKSPNELRLFLGYSGWAAGQLDAEILRGDWRVTRADAKTVFREDGDAIWRELFERTRGRLVARATPGRPFP